MRVGSPTWLASAAVCATALVASWSASAKHSWSNYHWSRTSTLSIKVAKNVSTAWDSQFNYATNDWTQAGSIDLIKVTGSADRAQCPATYGRVEACSYAYGKTGWLGLGQVWTSDGHIVQGTVKLNDTYFADPRYNTAAWRRFVVCQELGHTLGLDHQDINTSNPNLGSCMDYTSDPTGTLGTNGTLNNKRPNKHDYDQLALIYQHKDSSQLSSTTTSSGTSAAAPPAGDRRQTLRAGSGITQGEWGRAIARDARGRGRVFVRDLSAGVEVVTFVLWVDDSHESEHTH